MMTKTVEITKFKVECAMDSGMVFVRFGCLPKTTVIIRNEDKKPIAFQYSGDLEEVGFYVDMDETFLIETDV